MNNATTRYAIRALLAGLLAAAASLQANLPGLGGDDIVQAVIAGLVGLGVFAGVSYATPVDKSVGKGG